jgi:hypothetical protein
LRARRRALEGVAVGRLDLLRCAVLIEIEPARSFVVRLRVLDAFREPLHRRVKRLSCVASGN